MSATMNVTARLVMVYMPSAEAAEEFARVRGWTTHCLLPVKKETATGIWLVKGVPALDQMPEHYHAVRLFPNDFAETVKVTCGRGEHTHTHVVPVAIVKVYGGNHEIMVAHEVK